MQLVCRAQTLTSEIFSLREQAQTVRERVRSILLPCLVVPLRALVWGHVAVQLMDKLHPLVEKFYALRAAVLPSANG
jgi:hypothetical protein